MAKPSSRMLNLECLQDDKFFSRLLSREKYNSSKQGEASFRVLYYGGATSSVPFLWESQPGTPKHKLSDNPLPPLTPPPQYQSSPRAKPLQRKHSKNYKIFNFSRLSSKKVNTPTSFSSPPSSSTLSPFSYSSHSCPSTPFHTGKSSSKARSRSIVHFGLDEDEYEPGTNSPTSTLCFGPGNGSPSRRFKSVKKVVMSIVGHGTSN